MRPRKVDKSAGAKRSRWEQVEINGAPYRRLITRVSELLPEGDLLGGVRRIDEAADADEMWARKTLAEAHLPTDLLFHGGVTVLALVTASDESLYTREWFAVDVLRAARDLRKALASRDIDSTAGLARRMTLSGLLGRAAERLDDDALWAVAQQLEIRARGKRGAKTNTDEAARRKAAVARAFAALPERYKRTKKDAASEIRRQLLRQGIQLSTDRIRHLI